MGRPEGKGNMLLTKEQTKSNTMMDQKPDYRFILNSLLQSLFYKYFSSFLVYSLLNWTNFKVQLTCIINSRAATYGTFQKFTENLSSIHLNFKEHVRTDPYCLTLLRFKKKITSVTIIIIIFFILPIPLFLSNFHRNIWRLVLNTYLFFPPYCYITFLACIFTTFLMFSQFQGFFFSFDQLPTCVHIFLYALLPFLLNKL